MNVGKSIGVSPPAANAPAGAVVAAIARAKAADQAAAHRIREEREKDTVLRSISDDLPN